VSIRRKHKQPARYLVLHGVKNNNSRFDTYNRREQLEQNSSLQDDGSDSDDGVIPFQELGINRLLVQERYKAKREKAKLKGKKIVTISHLEIERLMKKFKTHRCALDFDAGFIEMVVKTTTDNNFLSKKKQLPQKAEHEFEDEDESDEDNIMEYDDMDDFVLPDFSSESESEDETD
jgi:hypothetical protein